MPKRAATGWEGAKPPTKKKKAPVSRHDELAALLDIDRLALDEMLCDQPSNFYAVADYFAGCLRDRDEAREASKRAAARASSLLKEKLESESGKKPTVKELSDAVELDARYRKTRVKYKEAEAALSRADGLKEAFRQRANVLSALARLQQDGAYQQESSGGSIARKRR